MADQLEEIKRKIDIVELINEFVPLKKMGRNFKALCPFHSEKTPSFVVSPERQIWHCFGACNTGGDIFGFLMKMENIEFGEALKILAKRAGVKLTRHQPSQSEKQKQLFYEINHLASEFFHYLLIDHPAGKRALDYVLGRGISRDSIERFKLGFAPKMWDGLQRFLVSKKGYQGKDLEGAGLVIRRSAQYTKDQRPKTSDRFYDRFRNRLIFPLKNHRGYICGFAGRVLDPGVKALPANRREAKYVNTPETLIYHKSDLLYDLTVTKNEIKKVDQAVIVEGELDAISSYQAGIGNVVAIKGSALTLNQAQLLSRFSKNIVLALDADLAGDQAARRGIEVADQAGMAVKVVEVKGGKDPDEVAQKDPLLWQKLIKNAVPIYDYFLDSVFSRFDSTAVDGKRKIGQELVPVLAKITDKIVQSHYIKLLAEGLAVEQEAISAQMNQVEAEEGGLRKKEKIRKEEKTRREILEEHLLALGLQSNYWSLLGKKKAVVLIKTPRFVRIIEALSKYLKRFKTFKSERLVKLLTPELVETFDRLYLLELADLIEDEKKFKQEFDKTILALEGLGLKEKLREIAAEIGRIERKKELTKTDEATIRKLSNQFRDLSAKLAEPKKKK